MLLVLTSVTVVSVALLAEMNQLTMEPIAAAKAEKLNKAVSDVLPGFTNDPIKDKRNVSLNGREFMIYPGVKEGKSIGAAVEAISMGFGGDLKVLVGFNEKGEIIDYSILESSETPGLGTKADVWFKKGEKGDIIGKSPVNGLKVSKDGGTVDAITASTITSRAFLKAINDAYEAFKKGNVEDKE